MISIIHQYWYQFWDFKVYSYTIISWEVGHENITWIYTHTHICKVTAIGRFMHRNVHAYIELCFMSSFWRIALSHTLCLYGALYLCPCLQIIKKSWMHLTIWEVSTCPRSGQRVSMKFYSSSMLTCQAQVQHDCRSVQNSKLLTLSISVLDFL